MKLNIKRIVDKKISSQTIIDYLLKDRDIADTKTFLNPPLPTSMPLSSFFKNSKKFKKDFDKTLKLLKTIHQNQESIVVYTDYDADGITAGAVLWETLHLLGFKVMPYVPDRKREGYGFSKIGIDAVKKQYDPALIISCDHGIVAHDQITYAKSLGIPIIVTDHHQRLDSDPDAFAIFHTDKLSGSGVSYFFAKEIFNSLKSLISNPKSLEQHFVNDYLALASIGTIADLVPLIDASRSVAYHGLSAFSKTKRVGLLHLLHNAQIAGRAMTPYEIGFMIAPRINAFGRLGLAIDALRLLCTVKETRALELAIKAGDTNKKRQELVEKARLEAQDMVDADQMIIIVYSEQWEEGIIGLIASKLVEKFSRPAIVLTKSDGFAKASARSITGFDITGFLRNLKKYLVDVGGHKAAAGFTIETNKIPSFIKAAEKSARELLTKEDLIPTINVDIQTSLENITFDLASELEKLSPFGIGNAKPTFYTQGELINASVFGTNRNHLKIQLKDSSNGFPLEVIFFGKGSEFATLSRNQSLGVVYSLDINRWNGKQEMRGMGKHLF